MRKRVGDTLIEVSIAIGIFSMVAISIVAVMNGGTSSSQTALETTLAREEIDTQAEALRFIQSAYIADRDSGEDSKYNDAWGDINGIAIDPSENGTYGAFQNIINNTTSCDVYSNEVFENHAFIVNPKNMNIVTAKNNDIFNPASTYPRLIMSSQINGGNTLSDSLVDNSLSGDLSRVEGLYVFAVKDADTTNITDPNNSDTSSKSAFLDFYIRACWYGNGDDTPSTISTVVRLYNPDATATASKATGVWVKFDPNNREGLTTVVGSTISMFVGVGKTESLTPNGFTRDGYEFVGWSTSPNSTPSDVRNGKTGTYQNKAGYASPSSLAFNDEVTLYAIWQTEYYLRYDTKWNGWSAPADTECDKNKGCRITSSTPPSRPGYKFIGWCDGSLKTDGSCNGSVYEAGAAFPNPSKVLANKITTLNAVWEHHYTLTYYNTNGTTPIRAVTKTTPSGSYPFTIDGSLSNILTKPNVSQTGNEMELLGWSENKNGSEPIYDSTGKNGKNYITATSSKYDIKLYPVWREIVTFTNVPWADISDRTSYGSIATDSKGNITLTGYGYGPVKVGKYFSVNKNDSFELSAKLTTSDIIPHPKGAIGISIGPLLAIITRSSSTGPLIVDFGYLPVTQTITINDAYYALGNGSTSNYTRINATTIPSSGSVTLKMTKYDNVYTMTVGDEEASIKTVENGSKYNVVSGGKTLASNLNISQLDQIKIVYSMVHESHGCDRIFKATLTDIKMTTAGIYYDQ